MPVSLEHIITQSLEDCSWAKMIPAEARQLQITEVDAKAAWELYIELATRIATQPLEDEEGVEVTALESIASLFGIARQIMRASGPSAAACSALAISLLNHRVRFFTAPWHKRAVEGRLSDPAIAGRFRDELSDLQQDMRIAADALTELAGVPRLTCYTA